MDNKHTTDTDRQAADTTTAFGFDLASILFEHFPLVPYGYARQNWDQRGLEWISGVVGFPNMASMHLSDFSAIILQKILLFYQRKNSIKTQKNHILNVERELQGFIMALFLAF